MANTKQEVVTAEWKLISSGDCTIQSAKASTLYDIYIGSDSPAEVFITLALSEPSTFAYKSSVWIRLNAKGSAGIQSEVTVIS